MKIDMPWSVAKAIAEFLEERRSDIMLDMENFGPLKIVLEWAEKEGFIE